MLELISSWLLSLWMRSPAELQPVKPISLATWLHQSQLHTLMRPQFSADPNAGVALETYLNTLTAQGWLLEEQGVWIQSGNKVLAGNQGTVPLPAASLTKIATTLAALSMWTADHQFVTLVSTTGSLQNGVLQGDLVIQGGGNPLFVWEEAIALGNALNRAGVQTVNGDLIIAGDFAMNYESDPVTAGNLLRQALDSRLWSTEAEAQFAQLPAETPRPSIQITGTVQSLANGQRDALAAQPLIQHQSLPLAQLLKLMNIYSNNFMAEMLAEEMGGADQVAQRAAQLAYVPSEEIQLVNGSGLGVDNRISARAVCAMLIALQHRLADANLTVADLFPVAGRDIGTLKGRDLPLDAAVKTGTLSEVSALAGAIPTRDRDLVWFAIINRGWKLDELRADQDKLLQSLAQSWGSASPTSLVSGDRLSNPHTELGAAERNQILINRS